MTESQELRLWLGLSIRVTPDTASDVYEMDSDPAHSQPTGGQKAKLILGWAAGPARRSVFSRRPTPGPATDRRGGIRTKRGSVLEKPVVKCRAGNLLCPCLTHWYATDFPFTSQCPHLHVRLTRKLEHHFSPHSG